MATPTVYVFCGNNCRYEGMTKEQILTAIMQAVQNGSITDVDAGFVTTLKTINGKPLKFFYGTQAEYDALTAEQKAGLFALITNDTTKEGLLEAIASLNSRTDILEKITEDLKGRAESLEGRADSLEEKTATILPHKNVADAVLPSEGWYFGHIYSSDLDKNLYIPLFYWNKSGVAEYPAALPYSLKVERDGTCKAIKAEANFYFEEDSAALIFIKKVEY